MNISPFFLSLSLCFNLIIFSSESFAQASCSAKFFEILTSQVRLNFSNCEPKIIPKSIFLLQLRQALRIPSDYEAVIKRENKIYRPGENNYRSLLQTWRIKEFKNHKEQFQNLCNLLLIPKSELIIPNFSANVLDSKIQIENFSRFRLKFNQHVEKLVDWLKNKNGIKIDTIQNSDILSNILHAAPFDSNKLPQFTWIEIPLGSITLGSAIGSPGHFKDEFTKKVTIQKKYKLSEALITQKDWVSIFGSNPSRFKTKEFCPDDYQQLGLLEFCPQNPVENISYSDIKNFIRVWNFLVPTAKVVLPSNEHWEYAIRGGQNNIFWFGNSFEGVSEHCWFEENSNSQTHAINSLGKNQFGLLNTCGNVWQMTAQNSKVWGRGGSWTGKPRIVRHATKIDLNKNEAYSNLGFRLELML